MNKNVSAIERDSNQYNEMLKQFAVSALILCTSQQLFCLFLLDFIKHCGIIIFFILLLDTNFSTLSWGKQLNFDSIDDFCFMLDQHAELDF